MKKIYNQPTMDVLEVVGMNTLISHSQDRDGKFPGTEFAPHRVNMTPKPIHRI